MAIVKATPVGTETEGHISRCISAMCSALLQRGGEICYTVIENVVTLKKLRGCQVIHRKCKTFSPLPKSNSYIMVTVD